MSAPLRIVRRLQAQAAPGAAGGPENGFNSYLARLVKLIPAEVVALYLTGNGFITPGSRMGSTIWAGICLGLVVLVRVHATRDKANHIPPQGMAVLISAVSFVIWVYTMGGPFLAYGLANPRVGSLAVLVWTFVVPFIYQGS